MEPLAPLSDEHRRLEALRRYDLADAPPPHGLGELVGLAATVCETPIAFIALDDGERIRFLAPVGLAVAGVARADWPAAGAAEPLVVADAAADPGLARSALAAGEPGLRLFAAAPLVAPTGEVLGSLCVADRVARTLTGAQVQALRVLGGQVMTALEGRRHARALERREKLLAAIYDSEPECVKLIDAGGRLQMMNKAGLAMIEADSLDEVAGASLLGLVAPPHRAAFEALTARVFAGASGLLEFQIVGLRGTERWLETNATPLRDEHGKVMSLLAISRDVTGRKQVEEVEEALRASEKRFSAVFHGSPIGIGLVGFPDGRIVEVNDSLVAMSGNSREEMIGHTVPALEIWVQPGERDRVIEELSAGAGRVRRQTILRRRSGEVVDVRLELARIDIDGEPMLLVFIEDVTREVEAERALRETDEQIAKAFRRSPAPLVVLRRRDLAIVEVSDALLRFFDADRDRVIGRAVGSADPLAALDLGRIATDVDHAGALRDVELRVESATGPTRTILLGAEPIDLHGEAHLIATFADITLRKRAEEERARLVGVLEGSLHRIQRLTRLYTILSEINQLIVRAREPRELFEATCQIAVDKGGFLLAWVGLANLTSGEMEVVAHAGPAADYLPGLSIGLREGPTAQGPTARAWRSGVRVVSNDLATDAGMASWRDRALAAGFRASTALPLTVRGVTVGTLNLYADEPGFFDAGELRLLDELALDVAFALELHEREQERQRAQDELRDSEHRFRQLAETIEDVFWIRDAGTRQVVYVSPAYETVWGRPCTWLYAHPDGWLEMIHPDDRDRIARGVAGRPGAGGYEEEFRIVRPDGSIRRIQNRAYVVDEHGASRTRIVGVAKDVTDSRALEDQLRQAQKMEAIGQLSGGVAHDFNNILAVILMHVELARREPDLPDAVRTTLEEIGVSAQRAADLTRKLLVFSRRQVLQPRRVDLVEQIASLAAMLHRILGEDIDLRVDLPPHPLVLEADPGMLDQLLMNLVVNARDAMPRGGTLVIEAREGELDAPAAQAQRDAMPGRHVCLRVSDTGTGIAPEAMPHVFEPFFTTKEPGKGTGLGLATVFGIVKQHGGWIRLESEPGRGTTFRIYLPLAGRGPAASAADAKPEVRGGHERILVVEDDAALRRIARRVLEDAGYRVLEAGDGIEALAVWTSNRGAVDLVLTDILMPQGLSGRDLAARLRAEAPDLPIVFTSGYAPDVATRGIELGEGQAFLQKPYPTHELLGVIRACLDRKGARG